jgi:signal transduction histidine kinase
MSVTEGERGKESAGNAGRADAIDPPELAQIAAGLAHEIRNSLNAITLSTSLVKKRSREVEVVERIAGSIAAEADKIDRILGELLLYCCPSKLERSELDLVFSIQSLVRDVAGKIEGSALRLVTDLEEGVGPVKAHPYQIREVFSRILQNAIDASGSGGMIEIRLRTIDRDGLPWAEVHFRDRGRGMDEETVGKAFSPFFSARKGKVGLGLSISRKIVWALGGEIRLESSPGEGTVVRIWLPVCRGHSQG